MKVTFTMEPAGAEKRVALMRKGQFEHPLDVKLEGRGAASTFW